MMYCIDTSFHDNRKNECLFKNKHSLYIILINI